MSHIVHLGDCLDPVTGLASLPDKSVDHVITDPPYEAEAHTLGRRVKVGANVNAANGCRGVVAHVIDFAPITEDTRLRFAAEAARVSRGWVIVFCQAEAVATWRHALAAGGSKWRRPMIWVKPDGQPCLTGDRPGMGYESMAAAWAGPGRSVWNGGGKCGVYTCLGKHNSGDPVVHVSQKPLALMEALIRDFTDPGELICDPFAGSGTTGVAAKRLGRRFVGWERDPKYHAIAEKRIAGAREQLRMFEPRVEEAG